VLKSERSQPATLSVCVKCQARLIISATSAKCSTATNAGLQTTSSQFFHITNRHPFRLVTPQSVIVCGTPHLFYFTGTHFEPVQRLHHRPAKHRRLSLRTVPWDLRWLCVGCRAHSHKIPDLSRHQQPASVAASASASAAGRAGKEGHTRTKARSHAPSPK